MTETRLQYQNLVLIRPLIIIIIITNLIRVTSVMYIIYTITPACKNKQLQNKDKRLVTTYILNQIGHFAK